MHDPATPDPFQLLLFARCPVFAASAVDAGVQAVVVDWEHHGKHARQASADTEVNEHTLEDLSTVRAATDATVVCRVNACHAGTAPEVESAIDAGADEIMLPMVRSAAEVDDVLGMVSGRCDVSILVETRDGVAVVDELAALPVSRAYIGLNDLAIDRGTPSIFTALVDGTVEHVCERLTDAGVAFGFGGLTLPGLGTPLPCRLLIGEMARLGASFSFLRRSFYRDVAQIDVDVAVWSILDALDAARARTADEIARDREQLVEAVGAVTLVSGPDRYPDV